MGARWDNIVKDYFTFSAKERKGVLLGLALIAVVYLLLLVIPVKKPVIPKDAFANELAQLKITVDSSHKSFSRYNNEDNTADYYKPKDYDKHTSPPGELFAFDPNKLDAEGWKKLGVQDRTVSTIQKFLTKGFHFKQADDLKKIYGLSPQLAERLIPYVRIAQENVTANSSSNEPLNQHVYAAPTSNYSQSKAVKIIDVNLADTSAFISLPGIGSRLAARIVGYRDKLGGFYSVGQVGETYGVPDSTFQKIKGRLQYTQSTIRKININTADVNVLKSHPYIRWAIANAIINYRTQHGNYSSLQDLRKIEIITDEAFAKISPYLEL